ncbi:MAG: hypothetical protein KDJ19_06365 [Hyphomicrobiaceae bacterium]|nr:hypothetical protein [Hyphomicrobiaceae bacterium]MCC0024030.1 hypothetical protein [Hyphomicrobiaceae bacterium]
MHVKSIKLAAALLATLLSTGIAAANGPFDLQGGGQVKPRVTKMQMGIVSPDAAVCPAQVPLKVWVFSNKPGAFPILLVSSTGVVLGPYQVQTQPGSGGVNLGTWENSMLVGSTTHTSYRVVTPNSEIATQWVPLNVEC